MLNRKAKSDEPRQVKTRVKARAPADDDRSATPASGGATSSPRSLMRVLRILGALAKSSDGMTLAEISQIVKAPKSSLLTLLRPLVAEGHFTHNGGRYQLGPPIFQLAADILSGRKFPKLVRPYMEELAQRTEETVILGTLDVDARRVIYVEVVESNQTVRYSVPPGTSRTLYGSTGGQVLLAFQNPAWRESYLKTEKLKRLTPHTLTDRVELRRVLEQIRVEGYAIGVGQTVEGAAGIAAPIFSNSTVVAVLMIGAPADRLQARLLKLKEALLNVAGRVSGELQNVAGTPTH